MLVEGYVSVGMALPNALAAVDESLELAAVPEPRDGNEPAPEPVPSAADNDRALAELQEMMAGVR